MPTAPQPFRRSSEDREHVLVNAVMELMGAGGRLETLEQALGRSEGPEPGNADGCVRVTDRRKRSCVDIRSLA